jgi:hypothetical protein
MGGNFDRDAFTLNYNPITLTRLILTATVKCILIL